MTRILHLSDLHFGTETPDTFAALEHEINILQPSIIIISGDFTQTASHDEFTTARDFIAALAVPCFCVPGNHDIPSYNLLERFCAPYKRYKRYINGDIEPRLTYDHTEIIGLNTARRALPHWNWANGAISRAQRACLMQGADKDVANIHRRICVMHHPINKAEHTPLNVKLFGARKALETLEDANIDLVLTGHVHHASVDVRESQKNNHRTIFVSASTALSSRTRKQENGFNFITLSQDEIHIAIYKLQTGSFSKTETHHFD
jgi:3',5'-cyclic AMP phosphodiesterase CpdA|tara:strand:+ start:29182 stop:29967 length:786 start_codon:yes stop_codon:yes gene_type:complete